LTPRRDWLHQRRIILAAQGAAFLALSAALIIVMDIHPVFPKYDDGWFALVSYSWINGLGFTNLWVSPIPTSLFNWHGFLQPLVVAKLAPCTTLNCVKYGLSILQFIYLIVWTLCVLAINPRPLLKLSLFSIGLVMSFQFSARPELLASLEMNLLLAMSWVGWRSREIWATAAAQGVIGGVAAVTDPVAGVFCVLIASMATAIFEQNQSSWLNICLRLGLIGLCAIGAALICLEYIYPFGPAVWISGIREASTVIANRSDTGGLIKYFVFSRMAPLLALMAIPLIFAFGRVLRLSATVGRFSLVVTGLAVLVFTIVVVMTSVRIPATYYNFCVVVPALALASAALLSQRGETLYERIVAGAMIVFAGAAALTILLVCVDKLIFLPQQAQLKSEISALIRDGVQQKRKIAMDPPLIQAVDDIDTLKTIKLLFFGKPGKTDEWPQGADMLIRAQTEFGTLPPAPAGSKLVTDRFDKWFVDRFIKPESLNYAVYVKDNTATNR
jgi:hypothetical protein